MAQLKILGAQRVKALTAILEKQRDEEIRELSKGLMSPEDKENIARKHFGVSEVYAELKKKSEEIKELNEKYREVTGYYFSVNQSSDYRSGLDFNNYVRTIKDPVAEEIQRVKREYEEKANSLWLCETLEEAKEIVGIE